VFLEEIVVLQVFHCEETDPILFMDQSISLAKDSSTHEVVADRTLLDHGQHAYSHPKLHVSANLHASDANTKTNQAK
jgi:hypothetical protein